MGNTINSSQSACVEGVQILDGKLAATEVLGDVREKLKKTANLKLDFGKAYLLSEQIPLSFLSLQVDF